jgi:hypothetical protein
LKSSNGVYDWIKSNHTHHCCSSNMSLPQHKDRK